MMQSAIFSPRRLFCAVMLGITLFPTALFAAPAAPDAQSKEVTFITEKSAKLNGKVNANELPDTRYWFEWGLSGREGVVYETPHTPMWYGQQIDTSVDIIGLAPSTQYFSRQVAENGHGRDQGATIYFTTKPLPTQVNPIVIAETTAATVITESGVTLKGYISPHGNTTTQWWFQWGETNELKNETPHNGWGADSGPVQAPLVSLNPGTVYYYRVVAENSEGRVYGALRVFVTHGTPPPPPEAPRAQNIPNPQTNNDGTARTTTNSGAVAAGTQPAQAGAGLPGDFFGAFFGRKASSAGAGAGIVTGNTGASASSANAPAQAQAASVFTANPFQGFWNALTGKKDATLVIEKVGPENAPVHTPIEYQIRYTYLAAERATAAKLKVMFPAEVVYIGDNTVNELLLEESPGPERTYILPVGVLEKGSTRMLSILGMTTGDAKGFPDARARLEYTNAQGEVVVVAAQTGVVEAESAAAASSGGASDGFLPHSLLGWVLYMLFVAGAIVAIRKAYAYYEKRKAEIAEAQNAPVRHPPLESASGFLNGLGVK